MNKIALGLLTQVTCDLTRLMPLQANGQLHTTQPMLNYHFPTVTICILRTKCFYNSPMRLRQLTKRVSATCARSITE